MNKIIIMKYKTQNTARKKDWNWRQFILLGIFWISTTATVILADNLALLSGTLRTYQKAACDDEWLTLRCSAGTTLSIQLAQYGKVAPALSLCQSSHTNSYRVDQRLLDSTTVNDNVTCLWPQAIQAVVGLCQKQVTCRFQTSPTTFGGDPCPGRRKYVEVAYKCRPSEFKSLTGCENDVLQLQCNTSSRLAIYSASFGRTEYESVLCPQPKGVPEESCLSSYATETVMQMCHGKRKCALSADPTTFGNPCKPESRMYLKVIHTCVPRKVLQEKYQGETEPDELIFEGDPDNLDEEVASAASYPSSGAVEQQPSIYSPAVVDRSKSWVATQDNNKSAVKPPSSSGSVHQTHSQQGESGEVEGEQQQHSHYFDGRSISDGDENEEYAGNNASGYNKTAARFEGSKIRLVTIIIEGIQAYEYIAKSPEKLYLYIAISIACGLLMLVLLLLLKICIQRVRWSNLQSASKEGGGRGGDSLKPSLSHTSNTTTPAGTTSTGIGLCDSDDLLMDSNCCGNDDSMDLHSILLHNTTTSSGSSSISPFRSVGKGGRQKGRNRGPDELFPMATSATTTLGRNAGHVVRFSNSRSAEFMNDDDENYGGGNQEVPKSLSNFTATIAGGKNSGSGIGGGPSSFHDSHNIHYYYS